MGTSEPCGDKVKQSRMSQIVRLFSEPDICEPLISKVSAYQAILLFPQRYACTKLFGCLKARLGKTLCGEPS